MRSRKVEVLATPIGMEIVTWQRLVVFRQTHLDLLAYLAVV